MPTVSFNTHFPNYEVLAEVGRGTTRVVKAQHLPSGDLVVIKEYVLGTDVNSLRRVEHESQLMLHIDHPNLVRVREVQLQATMAYVVMDFVEAGDLRNLLGEEGILDIPTTIRLGLQLTGAFRAMHSVQLIHRAINPETILYRRLASGELHILLTDLGLAAFRTDDLVRILTDESSMGYAYVAPEQFDKSHQVDEAVDYYALGVVLYECLTGRVPFVLHNERELISFMQQVLTAPMPEFTTASGQPLPPSLATLLMCLLARNPHDRLRNADQLELLLEQSRLEHLNATWSAPNGPTSKTVADPPMTEVSEEGGVSESEHGQTKQTVRRKRTWWVELCIIGAAGLAFGLYNRTVHQQPDNSAMTQDSVVRKTSGRNKSNPKPRVVTPIVREENERNPPAKTEVDTVGQVKAEPVIQPKLPTDSVTNDSPVTDSAAVIQPDSAH